MENFVPVLKNKLIMENTIIPNKAELTKVITDKYPLWSRDWRQSGTNCRFEVINYVNHSWKQIRLVVKKSFFRSDSVSSEKEYLELKWKFKNIVPNQSFIAGKDWVVFAFCAPVSIKVDICASKNRWYIIEILRENPNLRKQLGFFIQWFKDFQEQWKIIDLYGDENLVISDDNKLYFVDSFVVFSPNKMITAGSVANTEYLANLLEQANT